jgi:hypothetical protein
MQLEYQHASNDWAEIPPKSSREFEEPVVIWTCIFERVVRKLPNDFELVGRELRLSGVREVIVSGAFQRPVGTAGQCVFASRSSTPSP